MILLGQIAAAVLLVGLTLCIECGGVAALIHWLRTVAAKDIRNISIPKATALVMQTTIAVVLLQGIVIFVWAGFYRWLCFSSWQAAFYYSATSYSTVGYGDVVVEGEWRLLGPLESMMGVLMCGISVSLLFALINRLVESKVTAPGT
jgi:hypothetical protein